MFTETPSLLFHHYFHPVKYEVFEKKDSCSTERRNFVNIFFIALKQESYVWSWNPKLYRARSYSSELKLIFLILIYFLTVYFQLFFLNYSYIVRGNALFFTKYTTAALIFWLYHTYKLSYRHVFCGGESHVCLPFIASHLICFFIFLFSFPLCEKLLKFFSTCFTLLKHKEALKSTWTFFPNCFFLF